MTLKKRLAKRALLTLLSSWLASFAIPALGGQHGGGATVAGGGRGNAVGHNNGGYRGTAARSKSKISTNTHARSNSKLLASAPRPRTVTQISKPATASTIAGQTTIVKKYYGGGYSGRGYYHYPSFWYGGYYSGWCCYAPGYYYLPVAPGLFYWSVELGFGYHFDREEYANQSGLKFVLDDLSKADKKTIERADLYLLDEEGKRGGTLGSISDFTKRKKPLYLEPGTYDLALVPKQADRQRLDISVDVVEGRITRVHPTFTKPSVNQNLKKETDEPGGQIPIPAPTT